MLKTEEIFSPEIKREYDESCEERIKFVRALPKGSHIHISGICGTGTGSVLSLLKQKGFYVTGSDKAFYPPMGDVVRNLADKVFEGYASSNLSEKKPDLVVIGNALSRGNPEVEYILEEKMPFCSMPEVFSAILIGTREECGTSVVVSGTHGKTTTSSLIASILKLNSREPGYFIGGVPTGEILEGSIVPPSKDKKASERIVVLEGDEYDSAFFAKYSKFHCYRPDIAVITNIEFDHGDIYQSIEDIKKEFLRFIDRIPENGSIVACVDNEMVSVLLDEFRSLKNKTPDILTYGENQNADLVLEERKRWDYSENGRTRTGQEITYKHNDEILTIKTKLTGLHNALNIAASILVNKKIGLSLDEISNGILEYTAVKRRQQYIAENNGVVLIEDFAHHPTEVKVTLQGIKEIYPEKKLIAVFEPRSNTSRREFFKDEYKTALSVAEVVLIKDIIEDTGYSGVASNVPMFKVSALAEELKNSGKEVYYSSDIESLAQKVKEILQPEQAIVVMSNGDFGGIIKKIEDIVIN